MSNNCRKQLCFKIPFFFLIDCVSYSLYFQSSICFLVLFIKSNLNFNLVIIKRLLVRFFLLEITLFTKETQINTHNPNLIMGNLLSLFKHDHESVACQYVLVFRYMAFICHKNIGLSLTWHQRNNNKLNPLVKNPTLILWSIKKSNLNLTAWNFLTYNTVIFKNFAPSDNSKMHN